MPKVIKSRVEGKGLRVQGLEIYGGAVYFKYGVSGKTHCEIDTRASLAWSVGVSCEGI